MILGRKGQALLGGSLVAFGVGAAALGGVALGHPGVVAWVIGILLCFEAIRFDGAGDGGVRRRALSFLVLALGLFALGVGFAW